MLLLSIKATITFFHPKFWLTVVLSEEYKYEFLSFSRTCWMMLSLVKEE